MSGFARAEVHRYAQVAIASGRRVVSDGMGCFRAFGTPAYTMNASSPVVVVPARRSRPSTGPNTVLGNVKNAITDSYHAIRGQHVSRYLAEFEYRFNRRHDLKAMIPRLLVVAARTPPMLTGS